MTPKYEEPMFTPAEMLSATGLAERRIQMWVHRGFFPVAHPGRGVPREYSLAHLCFLAYLQVANDAHIPLAEAAFSAAQLFPFSAILVPAKIRDIIRSWRRPDLAPRLFAIFHDGKDALLVTKKDLNDAWAPLHEGENWGITIDVTNVVVKTMNAAEGILDRRPVRPTGAGERLLP